MFSLVHISDLHLLSLEGAGVLDFANKRWIGGLNLLTNRSRHYQASVFEDLIDDINEQSPDHIYCTGDVTNLSFPQEFDYAKSLFDRFCLEPADITVLPGNHDTYVAEGEEHFERIFADYLTSDEGFDDASWPIVRTRGPITIVGLATSGATPWFTAYGVIDDETLGRLSGYFEAIDQGIVLGLHHPVVGKPAQNRIRGLRGHEALQDLLKRFQVEVVVHGHEHRSMQETVPGLRKETPVWCVPSGSYSLEKPNRTARYHILRFTDEGNLAQVEARIRGTDGFSSVIEFDDGTSMSRASA